MRSPMLSLSCSLRPKPAFKSTRHMHRERRSPDFFGGQVSISINQK
jgi:hypothetical protein